MGNPFAAIFRTFRPPQRRSLDAAGGGRRFAGLKPVGNLNNEMAAGASTVALRASSLYHNDPYARAAVDSLAAALVGSGYTPLPKHPNEAVRKALVALWKRANRKADVAGRLDLDGLAKLAALSLVRDGECFAILHTADDPDAPLRVELLHRDQLPMDRFSEVVPNSAAGNRIRAGIEFDGLNQPVAYHFLLARPGDVTAPYDGNGWQTIRIPAANVLHVFQSVEIGQVRGLSWLTAVVLKLNELGQYHDAALVKAKIAALMAGFVRDPEGQGAGLPGDLANGVLSVGMEPGALISLPAGSDITFSQPPTNTDFDAFVKAQLHAVAAGTGTTYEQVSGDYKGASFSSVRAGQVEFRRKVEPLQYQFAHQFYDPIWRRLITLAALSGALRVPGFFDDPEAFLACDWLPPRWDYVNPAQDVAADIDAINAGLKSRAQAVAERGYDVAAIDAERAADLARESGLGLPTAGAAPPANGVRNPIPLDDFGEPVTGAPATPQTEGTP